MTETPQSEPFAQLIQARAASEGVSTDTRADLAGKMFVALQGASFDGNEFVEEALDRGATHVVASDARWTGHAQVTVVKDTLKTLQNLARAYRRQWTCPVLGMTGSNGKTTTKELIRDVLSTRFEVHATHGNLNNHIGVPLTILNAPTQPEFVVVEMGANHQTEIALLSDIARPTHGYITNIGLAHLEGFGGEQGVFLGKKELFDFLAEANGVAFVQDTDSKVIKAAEQVQQKVPIAISAWSWAAVEESRGGGTVMGPGGRRIHANLEGSYNLSNVVAALSIGQYFGVTLEQATKAIESYVPTNHRSQRVQTGRNVVLLDAYNANPSSVTHALTDFAKRGHDDALAILGDMAELGDSGPEAHRKVAELALESGVALWTVGECFERAKSDVTVHGTWRHFQDVTALQDFLSAHPIHGRHVLIKGSRSVGLERILSYL